MANTVEVTLNGTVWKMPASYKASRDIALRVGDPLRIAIDAHTNQRFDITAEQVVDIICIGVAHAGCSLDRETIGEAIYEGGLTNFYAIAGEYIGSLVAGGPEKQSSVGKKKK